MGKKGPQSQAQPARSDGNHGALPTTINVTEIERALSNQSYLSHPSSIVLSTVPT